jgi:hypothetical protein
MDLQEWERKAERAFKRIDELEAKVKSLEQRMNNQFEATQDLINRVGKLERGMDGGTF